MIRPSWFIVGHSKSGTSALSAFLGQHPDLFVCKPEEPNYFVPSWCRAAGPPSHFFPRSEEEYLRLFAAAAPGQACGEASAAYLYSAEAAGLIAEFCPAARIVMIFREPVDFLRSYHLQLLKNPPEEGEDVRDFGRAIELEAERRAGRSLPAGCLIPEMLFYAGERLRYEEHYARFAARFPAEQILPLVYDDFRADNAGTVRRVFEFLGVDSGFAPDLGDHNTGGAALRSRRLAGLMRTATHGGGAIGAARTLAPRRLRRRAAVLAYERVVFEPAPALDPAPAARLRELARPHVAALGERLGRDLERQWGYRGPAAGAPLSSSRTPTA